MLPNNRISSTQVNTMRSVHHSLFTYYLALVLGGALLFSLLTLSTNAQSQQDSKSLEVLQSLLKEAAALTKDESVRSALKQASETVLRAKSALRWTPSGSDVQQVAASVMGKESARASQELRDLLRRVADLSQKESREFQEKITAALTLVQENPSTSDVARSITWPGAGMARDQNQPATTISTLGFPGATAIAAGLNHTCALVSGGSVRCWGRNDYGQLGDGSAVTRRLIPVTVSGLSGATSIVAGDIHTCALVSGGTVRCWGNNSSGQLGDGTTIDRLTSVAVNGLSGATAITAGGFHTCALVSRGTVRCWGANSSGQLGDGTQAFGITTNLTLSVVSTISGAIAIAAGGNHTCALISIGEVRCWGKNDYGQLGDGTQMYRLTPVAVYGLSGATAISAGDQHTCALMSSGSVRCWGYNDRGQLGAGNATTYYIPVEVTGLSGATAIAARGYHACAIVSAYGVRCWGANRYIPFSVTGTFDAAAIVAGGVHACVIVSGGAVHCWGDNDRGQLGDGTTAPRYTPVAVIGL